MGTFINDEVVMLPLEDVKVYEGAHNTDVSVDMICESIQQFGFQQPIIIDKNKIIVSGNALYKAARKLGFTEIPCSYANHLTDDEIAQYRNADNLSGQFASWNEKKLKKELTYILNPNDLQFCFDQNIMSMIGMSAPTQFKEGANGSTSVSNSSDKEYREGLISQQSSANYNTDNGPTEKQKEQFRNSLYELEKSKIVSKSEYIEYTCSSCGREVTFRKK